jgi:hypothetical protein
MGPLLLLLACVPQATETRYENHPTGELRAQYEVRVEPDGSELRHGAWTGWYPEGEVESEGRYEDGARTGEWTFRWPNGKRKEVGEYRDGLRTGTWRQYDERGKRIAQGRYREGHRDGKWTFWDAQGEVDAARSGSYSWQRVELTWSHLPEGFELPEDLDPEERARLRREALVETPTGFVLEGERRGIRREGLWTLRRPGGSVAFAGHCTVSQPSGPWVFVHADGTVDPDWMTGRYLLGRRVGPLEGWPEGLELPARDEGPDPRRAPPMEVDEAAAAALEAWIAAEPGARESALRPLLAVPQAALEAAVARLQTLDLAATEDAALGRRLNDELLRSLLGVAYEWKDSSVPGATHANALSVLRWRALFELVDPQDPRWRLLLDPQWRWIEPGLEWTPLSAGPRLRELTGSAWWEYLDHFLTARIGGEEVATAAGGRGTVAAVEQALDWLTRTQDESGCWEPGTPRGVEATASALLALQANGVLPGESGRAESVARGLRWLVSSLRADGRIATGVAADLRSHALALQAIAEPAVLTEFPVLLEATHRARDYLLAQQLPDGSWPRDPGGSQGDTLTTAYAWMALFLVAETRVRCAPEPRERALAWLDEHTGPDGATEPCDEGRVPVTTAWSALCRLFAGRDPAADPVLARQIGWLIANPTSIQLGDPLLDPEYACLGAHVLFQVGGKPWDTWNSTLKTQLIQVQKREGELAGSWDTTGIGPIDRTTATALRALTFEVYTRYGRGVRRR